MAANRAAQWGSTSSGERPEMFWPPEGDVSAVALSELNDDLRLVPEKYHSHARAIGKHEVAWRGSDILEVLEALRQKNVVILGVESVEFREAGSGPMVEAICDTSMSVEVREAASRADKIRLSRDKAIADIERNVRNPYGEDIWYCLAIDPDRAPKQRGLPVTEDDVVAAVAKHLNAEGWTINRQATTREHGVDLIITRG